MYRTIFVTHDGDELPGMSDVRMVQIFLRICHFGLEETYVSISLQKFPVVRHIITSAISSDESPALSLYRREYLANSGCER